MRQSKRVFLCSVALAILSLSTTIYIFLRTDRSGYTGMLYDIMVNVFGGAILGVIITLVEYNTARQACLQDFLTQANYINRNLSNPPILYYSDTQYFTSKDFGVVEKPWIFRKRDLEDDVSAFVTFLKKVSSIERTDFDNSYSALDFIFGNKKFKPWIYKEIYQKMTKFLNSASELTNYIEVMGRHVENYDVLVKKCMPIVKQWFFINIEENDDSRSCTVFSNQRKNQESIGELQHKIFGQKFKPDQNENRLVVCYRKILKRENDADMDAVEIK